MGTAIDPQDVWLLLGILLAGVAVCIYLEQNHGWAARTSGPVLALLGGMLLSNLKIMPFDSTLYGVVDDFFVPAAVPLLLFRANIVRIFQSSRMMMVAFHVAAVGTILGAFAAGLLFHGAVPRVPEIVGIMTGSYIGGGVNFMAIKTHYDLASELSNPLLVADNFIMAGIFAVLFLMAGSKLFLRLYPHPHTRAGGQKQSQELAAQYWRRKEIALIDIAKAVGIAFVIAAVSMKATGVIRGHIESPFVRGVIGSPYVLITILTVGAATLFHRQMERIHGAEEIGAYLLYLFFFVIGLRADLWQVIRNVPVLFLLCLLMAVTNLVFTMVAGRLLRLNLEELLLGVNATLGGAPSAAAMAIARGWPELVLPSVLAGIWGYAIGSVIGIAIAEILLQLA